MIKQILYVKSISVGFMRQKGNFISTFSKIGLVLALTMGIFLGMVGVAVSQTATQAVTASATVEAPVCLIGANPGTISFGTLFSGQTIAPSGSTEVTVTNESTTGISTGLTVSGSVWSNVGFTKYFGVTNTSVLLGTFTNATGGNSAYFPEFTMPGPAGTPSSPIVNLAPFGGTANLEFGLSVPVGQAPDSYTQTITVASTC